MKEYLTPDTIPKGSNSRVMAPRRAQLNRVRNVLPPGFGRIAMALHGRRINHMVIDVRKKTEHLFRSYT